MVIHCGAFAGTDGKLVHGDGSGGEIHQHQCFHVVAEGRQEVPPGAVFGHSNASGPAGAEGSHQGQEILLGDGEGQVAAQLWIQGQDGQAVFHLGIGEVSTVAGSTHQRAFIGGGVDPDVRRAGGEGQPTFDHAFRYALGDKHPHPEAGIALEVVHVEIEGDILVRSNIVGKILVKLDLAHKHAGGESAHAKIEDASESPAGNGVVQPGLGVQV